MAEQTIDEAIERVETAGKPEAAVEEISQEEAEKAFLDERRAHFDKVRAKNRGEEAAEEAPPAKDDEEHSEEEDPSPEEDSAGREAPAKPEGAELTAAKAALKRYGIEAQDIEGWTEARIIAKGAKIGAIQDDWRQLREDHQELKQQASGTATATDEGIKPETPAPSDALKQAAVPAAEALTLSLAKALGLDTDDLPADMGDAISEALAAYGEAVTQPLREQITSSEQSRQAEPHYVTVRDELLEQYPALESRWGDAIDTARALAKVNPDKYEPKSEEDILPALRRVFRAATFAVLDPDDLVASETPADDPSESDTPKSPKPTHAPAGHRRKQADPADLDDMTRRRKAFDAVRKGKGPAVARKAGGWN